MNYIKVTLRRVLLAGALIGLLFAGSAQSLHEKVKTLMDHCYENGLFNGNILVVDDGQSIFEYPYGYANKENSRPLKRNSAFYLASVSKNITATGIMLLRERGELDYETTLDAFFSDFPDYGRNVTIRQLLTHTSGVPDHYRLGAYEPGLTNDDVYKILIEHGEPDFEAGEKYAYSNGGYVLLALIVEKVSGQSLHEFMRKNVLKPAGMHRTVVVDEHNKKVKNRTSAYNAAGEPDEYEIYTTGAGGMFTTARDLRKWDTAIRKNKVVSDSTQSQAFKPFVLNNGTKSHYGFGWRLSEDPDNRYVEHTGSMNGYRNYMYRHLDEHDAIIILTNHGDAFPRSEVSAALKNILNGKPYALPMKKMEGEN